jgi:hypothetical protein
LFRGFAFTGFETAQLALAMFLVVGGGLRLANGSPSVIVALAAVCLCCGGACYLSALRLGAGRNANIYAAFGLLLLLASMIIALPPVAAAAAWSVLAVALLAWPRQPLRWHAAVYLLLALLLSAALTGAARTLLGADNAHAIPPTVFWESAAAAACYALAVKHKALRLLRGILAATAVWLLAGASAAGLTSAYHAFFGPLAPHAFCATLRTVVLAAGAMLLAAAARRWQRLELRPLVYMWMALGAYRLLILDLHQDIKAAVVLSLLAYGAALTLLPRLIASAR